MYLALGLNPKKPMYKGQLLVILEDSHLWNEKSNKLPLPCLQLMFVLSLLLFSFPSCIHDYVFTLHHAHALILLSLLFFFSCWDTFE